ncbi:MAG: MerR family transcriptional regulator [Acidimicrobiales bacterium]
MAERTHLSIGEVLSLLREEFPDVTISKIRFLESQGLVDPERTPSGYRKFYDHDVERLRWILRQQRDQFLPLKVIKGRLSEHPDDDLDDGGRDHPPAGDAQLALTDMASSVPPGVSDGEPSDPDARAAHPDAGTPEPAAPEVPAPEGVAPEAPAPEPAVAGSAARRTARGASRRASQPDHGADEDAEQTYTLAELAEATGMTDEDVRRLEQFGLIVARAPSGGTAYFGPDALDVTRLAAEFGRHGVEARHLRAWKTAAEREASVFEQIVMPMLRQRNPTARDRAYATLGELADSGSRLRERVVRQALRPIH